MLRQNMHARGQRVALYGGTFDPIHHGHLILAREACERLELDRVVFIPAAISPHKLTRTPAPADVRLEMVRAATADEPRFDVDDSEVDRPGPSYTIDTVEAFLSRAEPSTQVYYFIGSDNIPELHTWRRADDLRRLVRFIVFGRDDLGGHDFPVISRRFDISATEVRQRVARGASIRYLVPESVREIISRHGLYQESNHATPVSTPNH